MAKKVDISYRTIIFTVVILLLLWLVYLIREIIFTLFIGFIFMSALNPLTARLENFKIPRALAIVFLYLAIFAFFGVVVAGIIPPLIDQTSGLLGNIPGYIQEINIPWLDKEIINDRLQDLGSLPQELIRLTFSVFMNVVSIFVVMVITFYLLMERKNLSKYLRVLFGSEGQEKATDFIEGVEKRLGSWVRAEILLMTIIGLVSYVGLRLLGVDFALPLAVLAGLLEVIPNIGPTIAAVPAVISGLTVSPLYGLAVLALYFFIQQVENTLIVPKVMQKGLGINPLIVIISLSIGLKLGGVVGMILAIPVYLLIEQIAILLHASDHLPKD